MLLTSGAAWAAPKEAPPRGSPRRLLRRRLPLRRQNASGHQGEVLPVSFQWKNPDFLSKNVDFILKNVDFLLENVDFITKQPEPRSRSRMLLTRLPIRRTTRMVRNYDLKRACGRRSRTSRCVRSLPTRMAAGPGWIKQPLLTS